jgi:hypothetical protein
LTLSVNSNAGKDTINLCLGEFGKIGDSEEELADPVQQGEAIAFLFRHLTFLLLFPFYHPDTINLHVLMVLSIGGTSMQCCFLKFCFFDFYSPIQASENRQ